MDQPDFVEAAYCIGEAGKVGQISALRSHSRLPSALFRGIFVTELVEISLLPATYRGCPITPQKSPNSYVETFDSMDLSNRSATSNKNQFIFSTKVIQSRVSNSAQGITILSTIRNLRSRANVQKFTWVMHWRACGCCPKCASSGPE